MIWRGSMHSDRLRDMLEDLNLDAEWFFNSDMVFDSRDLLELPQMYLERLGVFISTHSSEELNELEPKDFIEQATGESYDKVVKLINVAKKKQDLEQDFN